MVHTPAALADSIMSQLARQEDAVPQTPRRPWTNLASALVARPLLVAGLALAAIVMVITQPTLQVWRQSTAPAAAKDVVLQSLANYHAMVGGSIKPQRASAAAGDLKEYFAGKTDFPVHVPVMKEWTLLGGSLDDFGGEKVAHVMYQRNSGIIYVYQVCREMAMKGERLSLTDDVRDELQRTGWYTQSLPDSHGLVVWIRGGTLCAAVACMTPSELVALLQSEEKTELW